MQRIITKIDYELYEEMFFNTNLDKAKKLWENLITNPMLLNDAIKIVTSGPKKRFLAPMICFMILKYHYMVPNEIYKKLIKQILSNPDIINNIKIGNDCIVNYISLILDDNTIELDEFAKKNILAESSQKDNNFTIIYQTIPKVPSPIAVRFCSNNFQVEVSCYEATNLQQGNIISYENSANNRNLAELRYAIINNPNFTEAEKNKVLTNLLEDFNSFILYKIHNIYSTYIKQGEVSIKDLEELPLEKIASKVQNNEQLIQELAEIRQMIQEHSTKSQSLIRNKKD